MAQQLAICGVALLVISCNLSAARAIIVAGLDRVPGTALEGMPDELWMQHTAEVRAYLDTACARTLSSSRLCIFKM